MPFVSAAAWEARQHALDTFQARVDAKDAEIRRLTDIIVGMKRQNYQPADAVLPPPQIEPPSKVEAAIRSHLPARLRDQVRSEVQVWRAQNMTEAQIVRRIQVGEANYESESA
jgi:hypothetical protein